MPEGPGLIPLRVLCLEDDPFDAELVKEQLSAGGYDVDFQVANGRKQFAALLAQGPYDIVLADFSLPDFDAFGALEASQAAGIEAPFICVSGMIGEEPAVELMKRGADDYVLKDRIGRLSFSVKRAMRSAEENAALRASQERFEQLYQNLADGLIVHNDRVILANPAAHRDFGYPEDADMEGMAIDQLIHPDSLDEAHRVMDRLRGNGGSAGPFELNLLCADGTTWFGEVIMSSLLSQGRVVFESTFRDLTDRRRREAELAESRAQLEELLEERSRSLIVARDALNAVTAVISRVVEIRDPYTAGHQRRVAALATAIAERLGMTGSDLEELSVAAAIHDIGKISVPAEVLSKPSTLSEAEFELIKAHAQAGYDIVSSARLSGMIALLVLQHHERCDGSGYPNGLKGNELLPGAKVLMVADVVEAMSSHRPYRTALGVEAAREEILVNSGGKFDREAVEACLEVLDDGFPLQASPA